MKNCFRYVLTIGLLLGVASAAMADGKALYDSKCAMCHGKDGKGNPAMIKGLGVTPDKLDLTDKDSQATENAKMDEIITKGQGKMKATAGVTPAQASEVTTYVKSLGGGATKKSEAAPAAAPVAAATVDTAKMAEIYKAKCAMCHAPNGKGSAPMAKTMGAAGLDLTDKATLDKTDADLTKITLEGAGKMPAYKGKVSNAEAAALTTHIRSLSAQ